MLSHNSFASFAHPFALNSPYLSRFILVATNTRDTVYSQESSKEVCILRMSVFPRRSIMSFWSGLWMKRDVLFSSGVSFRENSVFRISKCCAGVDEYAKAGVGVRKRWTIGAVDFCPLLLANPCVL